MYALGINVSFCLVSLYITNAWISTQGEWRREFNILLVNKCLRKIIFGVLRKEMVMPFFWLILYKINSGTFIEGMVLPLISLLFVLFGPRGLLYATSQERDLFTSGRTPR